MKTAGRSMRRVKRTRIWLSEELTQCIQGTLILSGRSLGDLSITHIFAGNIFIWMSHNLICRQAGFPTVPAVFLLAIEIMNSHIKTRQICCNPDVHNA